MGLFDGFKGEVQQQFIARPDSSKDLVLYKWPETNIRAALGRHRPAGRVGVLHQDRARSPATSQGGQHKLDGAQIPFLGGLIDSFTGGNVLMAELYFVSSREFANNKFGGSMGEVEDPGTGEVVRCGVFGEYVFKVVDPAKLILNLVGTQTIYSNEFIVDAITRPAHEDPARDRLRQDEGREVVAARRHRRHVHARVREGDRRGGRDRTSSRSGLQITRIEDFLVNMDEADRAAPARDQGPHGEDAPRRRPALHGGRRRPRRCSARPRAWSRAATAPTMAGLFVGAGIGQSIAGGIQSGQVQQAAQEAAQPSSRPRSRWGSRRAAAATRGRRGDGRVPRRAASPTPAGAKFCPGVRRGARARSAARTAARSSRAGAKFCPECGTKQE